MLLMLDWEVPHFGCIGHTLHIIVGPLFVQKRGKCLESNTNIDESILDNKYLDDTVDYNEDELFDAVNDFDYH